MKHPGFDVQISIKQYGGEREFIREWAQRDSQDDVDFHFRRL